MDKSYDLPVREPVAKLVWKFLFAHLGVLVKTPVPKQDPHPLLMVGGGGH